MEVARTFETPFVLQSKRVDKQRYFFRNCTSQSHKIGIQIQSKIKLPFICVREKKVCDTATAVYHHSVQT